MFCCPSPPPTQRPSPPLTQRPSPPLTQRPSPPPTRRPSPPPTRRPSPPLTRRPSPPLTRRPSPPLTRRPSPPLTQRPSPPPTWHRFTTEEPTLAEILTKHTRELFSDSVDVLSISIKRTTIWHDTQKLLEDPSNNWNLELDISFIDEPAQDAGGPKRDFFRLVLLQAIGDASIFKEISSTSFIPVHSTYSLRRNLYFFAGKIMSISIAQGGPGPKCFPEWLYTYIAYGLGNWAINVNEVPCLFTRNILTEIQKLAERNVEELRSYLQECTVLFDSGFSKPISHIKQCDVPDIVNTVGMHVTLMPILAEVNQLVMGLEFYDVLSLIRKFPYTMKSLFVYNKEEHTLTADLVLALFSNVIYSTEGTARKLAEEMVIDHFQRFISDVANGVINYTVMDMHDEDEEERHCTMTLEDVLVFATGANQIPPMGFGVEIDVKFTELQFPKASTCGIILFLPINCLTYLQFKTSMVEGIISGYGFGTA